MINNMDKEKKYPTREQVSDYAWERWDGDCYSQDDVQSIAYELYDFITTPLED